MTLRALAAAAAAVARTAWQLARQAVCAHPATEVERLLIGDGFRRRRCPACSAAWTEHG